MKSNEMKSRAPTDSEHSHAFVTAGAPSQMGQACCRDTDQLKIKSLIGPDTNHVHQLGKSPVSCPNV